MIRRALTFATLFLVSCAPVVSEPVKTTGSPLMTSSTPVASATAATELETREILGGWVYINAIAVSPRWLVWGGLQSGDAHQESEVLMILDRGSGQSRILAKAPEPAGIIAWIRLSDDWVAWADYTDRSTISDWTLRTARLPAGQPAILAVAPADSRLADRPEFDLRDGMLVVTFRPRGESNQQATLIDLASGSRRVLATASGAEIFGWPAIAASTVAFESHRPQVESILVMSTTEPTKTSRIGTSTQPASEPALANGWLAYKAADRSSGGPIAIRPIGDPAGSRLFGSQAEAPVGAGSIICWSSDGTPAGAGIYETGTNRAYQVTERTASVAQVVCDLHNVALLLKDYNSYLYSVAIAVVPLT